MELKDTVDLMLSDDWKPCLAEWNRSSGDISLTDNSPSNEYYC